MLKKSGQDWYRPHISTGCRRSSRKVSRKPFHGTLKKIPAEEPIASNGDAMMLFDGIAHQQ
jgi:hypothetical protein